uniref:hypothetical protein n=1 Tax=Marinobacterium profundum TaxID=1714300 RepID=UPI000AE379CE|nr:hypothetical protein [Marinobacterium profundum]
MELTPEQMAAVFNAWAERFADDPAAFDDILDEDGIPVEDYGDRCAAYFNQLACELFGV